MMTVNVTDLTHSEVMASYPELVANEVAYEEKAVAVAREAIQDAIASRGLVDASPTAKKSLKSCVVSTAKQIDQWIDLQAKTKRKSPQLNNLKILKSEQLAYLVSREVLNGVMSGTMGYTNACARVGESVRRTVEWSMFEEANEGLSVKINRQLAKSSSAQHKQSVFRAAMRSADFEGLRWEASDKAAVGFILVNCFVDATGLLKKDVEVGHSGSVTRLIATPTMELLLAEADIFDSLLVPYHYPMVIPPKPWTDLYDGGYLSKIQHPLTMVKSKGPAHLAQLEAADLSDVADAINTIQATPWRVNVDILAVMEVLHEEGMGGARLAGKKQAELPAKPWGELSKEDWKLWKEDDDNAAELKAWKKKASAVYARRAKWASKRLITQQQIALAFEFVNEPAIYFPHTADFRSRLYPAAGVGAMNPQGNDGGKALLEFARETPIGATGGRWLAIHTANVYGKDKLSLDDRELWTLTNSKQINLWAASPLEHTEWMEADKPLQFLAACFEWAGYTVHGEEHMTRLPIAMDGSCSGLQHFGGLLRDTKTAEATNLKQLAGKPTDVYTVVLKSAKAALEDAKVEPEEAGLRDYWLDRMNRDTVKHPVMTTPYGCTARGIIKQIEKATIKMIDEGNDLGLSLGHSQHTPLECAEFIAPYVIEAIGTEAAAARTAMDWLTHVARVCAKAERAVRFETPIGFLMVQDYRKSTAKQLKIKWAGTTHKMTVQRGGSKIDKRKMASGLAPNFVHSLDASHLMITVNNSKDHDIQDFAMIHDSFGCPAGSVELMNQVNRECFIAQYSGNILLDFYNSLEQQLPAEAFASLDKPPAQGDFELNDVRHSDYFFS